MTSLLALLTTATLVAMATTQLSPNEMAQADDVTR
jgi:hypothetical protein